MIKYICECECATNQKKSVAFEPSGQVKLTGEELVAWQNAKLFNIIILGAVEE